ncbi:MAG: hypothetical protein ACYCW6_16730 [Candidatus Xenobia bacterium]
MDNPTPPGWGPPPQPSSGSNWGPAPPSGGTPPGWPGGPPPMPMEIKPRQGGGGGCFLKGCLGCSVGCFGVMVAMAIAMVFVVRWMVAPNPLLNPSTLVGPDNRTFVLFHFDPANPGQRDMLLEIAQAANKNNPQQEQNIKNLRGQNGEGLQKMVPQVTGAVLSTYQDGKPQHSVMMFSPDKLRGLVRMMRWFAVQNETTTTYQNWRITQGKMLTADHDANFLLSDDATALHQAIDHVKGGSFSPPMEIKAIYDRLNAAQPCVGVVDNDAGELATYLPRIVAAPDGIIPLQPKQIQVISRLTRRLGFDVDIVSDDVLGLQVVLEARQPRAALVLQHMLQRVGAQLKAEGRASESSVTRDTALVTATFKLTGMQKRMESALDTANSKH